MLNAADTNQAQPEPGPSFTGDLTGGLFPTIPLTPCLLGGSSEAPDLSREGPFEGCQFRMTSYDVEIGGPDFSLAYGVQLHDPRLLEYVGAPESARLMSRSPEYWVHHMGREKARSAALQLQHDTVERPGPAAVSDSAKPDIVGHVAGSARSSAISGKCNATSDAILQSPPRGPLHHGDGSVAFASRRGDTRTHAVSGVHVLP